MSNEWGPWIGWNGGECPVDRGEVVQVSFKGRGCREGRAGGWLYGVWEWQPGFDQIVAYRVKKEPVVEVVEETVSMRGDLYTYHYRAQCTYTDGKLTKIH